MPLPPKKNTKPKTTGKSRPSKSKSKAKTRSWFRPLRWIRLLALGFLIASMTGVVVFRFVPPPLTPLMAIRYTEAIFGKGPAQLRKEWRPLERISPNLVEAVLASEDQLFPEHWGFDWDAILSAFAINSEGKRKLGASTITQQTAKNLFLWPDRSWTRKALEAYFTALLELFWNKRRILEVYLNIIETGQGIYGAEAAAQNFFGIHASALSSSQAALIAATLPNPRAWSPAKPSAYVSRRQHWILNQMDHLPPLPDNFSPLGQRPRSKPIPKPVRHAPDTLPAANQAPLPMPIPTRQSSPSVSPLLPPELPPELGEDLPQQLPPAPASELPTLPPPPPADSAVKDSN